MTVDAYRAFLRTNAVEQVIAGILRRIDPGNMAALEQAAAGIAGRLAGGLMPDEVADQLRQAYVELGSPLSHGSTVVREYGIPAVMGAGNATDRIRDGQAITVDGTAGKAYLA